MSRRTLGLLFGAALLAWTPECALAQARPDSVVRPAPPDTLAPADTIPADTIVADTIPADMLPPRDLPPIFSGPPVGWATATWSWDRDAFMGARDLTLLELLEEIPGVVPIRGGDYGAPEAASALGFGGGRVRVFWDGFEQLPLDGGVPDLALIGLGAVEELRVERGPGELRLHLESLRGRDPRPLSLVEAGTGDTDTNFFRGTFVHPRVFGGIFGFMLERVDTRGPFRREPGHRAGGWVSWTRPLGEHFAVRAEGRRFSRDVRLTDFPVGLERTDWVVRARAAFLEDRLRAELFGGGSSLESRADEDIVPVNRSRQQYGARLSWEPGPLWGTATLRVHGGADLPSHTFEVEGGGTLPRVGGFYARWGFDGWPDRNAFATVVDAWTAPVLGLSGFLSYGEGVRGAAIYPPYVPLPADLEEIPEVPPPGHTFSNVTTLRLGGTFQWRPLTLGGAWITFDADSFPPTGLVLDRPGPTAPGGTSSGVEGLVRLALPINGFALNGSIQYWNRERRYLPERLYQASLDFHDVFLETGNLEVWGAIGVKGRDPMLVPDFRAEDEGVPPALVRVPFYQNWYMDLQVRVLPVHLFIRWENFVLRENLQDLPERRLPVTRAVYGVKWILWN